jgi:hypothetical protein
MSLWVAPLPMVTLKKPKAHTGTKYFPVRIMSMVQSVYNECLGFPEGGFSLCKR